MFSYMRRVCSLRVNRINLFNTPLTPPWTKKVEKILINHNENLTVVKSPSFLLITQQTPFTEKQAGSSMDGCCYIPYVLNILVKMTISIAKKFVFQN